MPGDLEGEVTLSVLDRLTANSSAEPRMSPWETMRQLKANMCRDLTALLNTRRAEQDFDPSFEHSTNSLLTYGVVDFTSYNLKNGIEQERVRRSMERAIRQFEPRLTRVTVSLEPPDASRPVLRFQIEALLRVDPEAEPVTFDATLQRDTRRISVTGSGG